LVGYCIQVSAIAQDIVVEGGFLADSLKIGEETAYYLSARYPSDHTILFPDSSHVFTPFEYVRKAYFPTETTDGISADSTVYFLTTYEVDRVQYLDLPVYVLQAQDCTTIRTQRDSVLITQFVQQVPDSLSAEKLPLKMNTTYQEVFFDLNVILLLSVLVVLVFVSIVIWAIYGKRISRYFKAKRLQQDHSKFVQSYNAFLRQLQTAFSTPTTESALSLWKTYMEQLESKPYTKLTTRETLRLVKEPVLSEHLRRIDQAIYGHNTVVMDSLEKLKSFADEQFTRKLKEVKHG
jgi:hypothetical protein